jgi:mannose-6-phosphate isomerase
MVAEIQQSSDTTYRVSDWGRLGMDGSPRTLHRDKAALCIDFSKVPGEHTLYPFWSDDGGFIELMAACSYYYLEKIHITGRLEIPLEDDAFSLLMPLSTGLNVTKEKTVTSLIPFTSSIIPAQWTSMIISSETGEEKTILRSVPLRKKTTEPFYWRGNKAYSTNDVFF